MNASRWSQIESLFHRVAECGPEERARLLEEAGSSDPGLRQEVESLLLCEVGAGAHLRAAVRSAVETAGFPLSGEQIAHYRVLRGLGAGGMGVVYKAEDSKLGRFVALKFLPEELQRWPHAIERFKREARAASALTHPNICTIYEINEQDDRVYIAMECLEGWTLKDVLAGVPLAPPSREVAGVSQPSDGSLAGDAGPDFFQRGKASRPVGVAAGISRLTVLHRRTQAMPLRTEVLIDLGIQIADALDAAHRRGIIHRDLKPANIFVIPQPGTNLVKILDFGLAKLTGLTAGASGSSETGEAENVSEHTPEAHPHSEVLTSAGSRMGTIAYMSPEQVRGEDLDARTDLFSFGTVLYEMAAGSTPFSGNTPAAICGAILEHAPVPPSQLDPTLPLKLEEIILKALEKDRDLRYQTAAEMRGDLKRFRRDISSGRSTVSLASEVASPSGRTQIPASAQDRTGKTLPSVSSRSRWWTIPAVAVIVLAAIAGVNWWLSYVSQPLRYFQQSRLTANAQNAPVYSAAISPNGRYLGYSDQQGIHLQLVQTGETQSVPLPVGFEAGRAFWEFDSWYPDSTRFVAGLAIPGQPGSLWSVPIFGGAPRKLIEGVNGDAAFSPDGSSIAFSREQSILGAREIWLMGPFGESPHKILTATGQSRFGRIVWSPSSSRIAYEGVRQQDRQFHRSIFTCDLTGTKKTAITSSNEMTAGWGESNFVWIPRGWLVYRRRVRDSPSASENLWGQRVDPLSGVPKGKPRQLTDWSGFSVYGLSATRDGKYITYLRGHTHLSVFIGDLRPRGTRLIKPRRLTLDEYSNMPFAWTADSQAVIFLSNRSGNWAVYKQRIDHGPPQLITASATLDADEPRLSPDGSWVIFPATFRDAPPGVPTGIYRAPVNGGAPQLLFTVNRFIVLYCANRAANFCAYASHSADHRSIIVAAFNPVGGEGKQLLRIPTEPEAGYHWSLSPDGSQMAMLKNDWHANQIVFIPVHGGKTRTVSVKGFFNLDSLDWAADSKSVFVGAGRPSGAMLLRIGLNGKLRPIWQQPQANQIWGIASPDGRRIAIHGDLVQVDVWMLSNF